MLRINSASVLFVPPFECAWLSELSIAEGGGCLSFEAKGTCGAALLCMQRMIHWPNTSFAAVLLQCCPPVCEKLRCNDTDTLKMGLQSERR